jgi:hypothetical protein
MKNKVLLWTILFSLATMISAITIFAAPPSVDEFLGATWGYPLKQVEKTLKQRKGFKQNSSGKRSS